MSRRIAVWCGGLLSPVVILLASGQATGEEAKAPPRLFSKPVRVSGVDFEVTAEATWERPAEVYGVHEANIGLRISNRSGEDLMFGEGSTLRVSLKRADGAELVAGPIPSRFLARQLKVAAGKSETVTLPTHLFHTRIGDVCLGLKSDVGWNWLTPDVQPGEYRLCLSLESTHQGNNAWLGKVQTEMLDIEVQATR